MQFKEKNVTVTAIHILPPSHKKVVETPTRENKAKMKIRSCPILNSQQSKQQALPHANVSDI
jgi:hypothetical protein